MKKFFKGLLSVLAMAGCSLIADGKSAILVVHYGSSDPDTRAKTIDLITSDIREAFPGFEVMEAYISPVVRRNLAVAGVKVDSPAEAFTQLHNQGVDTVYVQSTTLIDGVEMAEVRAACSEAAKGFDMLKCGESLCYTPLDCEDVINALVSLPCAEGEVIVYVGHGNMLPSTATYSHIDYMFKAMGHNNFYMSTIEGYPTVTATSTLLKCAGLSDRKLKLVPFLLVCGNHTKKDISGEFAEQLNSDGFTTEVLMRGLGENPQIRKLYVERVKRLIGVD